MKIRVANVRKLFVIQNLAIELFFNFLDSGFYAFKMNFF